MAAHGRDCRPRYGLVEPFDVDDDPELDARAFMLGVEWAMFRERLSVERCELVARVHANNVDRLLRLLQRHARKGTARRHDETWADIVVPALILN